MVPNTHARVREWTPLQVALWRALLPHSRSLMRPSVAVRIARWTDLEWARWFLAREVGRLPRPTGRCGDRNQTAAHWALGFLDSHLSRVASTERQTARPRRAPGRARPAR